MDQGQARPRFCSGCPVLPKGVCAELTDSELITAAELRRYRISQWEAFMEVFVGTVRVFAKILSSESRKPQPGEIIGNVVDTKGLLGDALTDAIHCCPGPQQPTIPAALQGPESAQEAKEGRATCPVMGIELAKRRSK